MLKERLTDVTVLCSKCKTAFDSKEPKCPECGSKDRFVAISDSFSLHESRIGVEDKLIYPGKHKFFYEVTVKPDFDRDTQQNVMVTRKYNRRRDRDPSEKMYVEEIRTTSGELIKEATDQLSEHRGHGSDRKNRRP